VIKSFLRGFDGGQRISAMSESLIYRLRKRAEIRRQISTRKSVQEGRPDRIADLLEEAATALDFVQELADEDCSYGDNCPTFGSRHGKCKYCRAREVLNHD
jgi:hypothetical protein